MAERGRAHPVKGDGNGRAVAIVGMGCRLPGAPDLAQFWRVVQSGAVPVREVPAERWDHGSFHDPDPRALDRTYARMLASVDRIDEFCPEYFAVLPRRARFMDPQQRLFLDAARTAIEDAGRAPAELPRRTGVHVGISVPDYQHLTTARLLAAQLRDGRLGRVPPGMEPAWDFLTENVPPMQAYTMVGNMLSMAAASVAQAFDLRGPAMAADSACSSALVALADAVLQLRAGVCDAALVGGVFVACTPNTMIAFSRIGAISPSDVCRPFEERADGFVLGEGAACLLLKRFEDAVRDGDRIWAVVRGLGINNDGHGEGPMTPRREGQVAALEQAYADAGMSPAQIGLVEAHGTATRVGDMVESSSLAQVFGAARHGIGSPAGTGAGAEPCYLTSVKGNIGHTLAAAGAAGLMSAALSLAHRRIPPLAGYERARKDLPIADAGLAVAAGGRPREWAAGRGGPRAAAVSSFGFGGTNVHVVLEEAPASAAPRWSAGRAAVPLGGDAVRDALRAPLPATPDLATRERPERELPVSELPARELGAPDLPARELFVVSAPSRALLGQAARALAGWVVESEAPFADIAYTLSRRRLDGVRAAVVAGSRAELAERLERVATLLDGESTADVSVFDGKAQTAASAGEIAFLFPGQGAQAPDLCRDLWDQVPAYRERLTELASAAEPILGRSFLDLLYPVGPEAREPAAAELTRTEICQPALAAVELALVDLVRQLGLDAGVLLGHSLGEFVAVAAGGALPAEDAVRLVAERGRLMAALAGDQGAMAALNTDRDAAGRLLEGLRGAVLANFNHPRQIVVSGETAAVEEVLARARAAGVRATRLPVSHGFHSPILGPVADRFRQVLDRAGLVSPTRATVVSCAAAEGGAQPGAATSLRPGPFENEPEAIRARLAGHALAAVDFESGVRAAWRAGARVFLQIGGGSALLSMVSATLAQDGCAARLVAPLVPADAPPGQGLLAALARLIGIGVPIATGALFRGRDVRLTTLPASLLETRRFWILRPPADPPALPVLGTSAERERGRQAPANGEADRAETRRKQELVSQVERGMSVRDPVQQEIIELFRRQLDVIHGQLDVLRSRGIDVPAGLDAPAAAAGAAGAAPASERADRAAATDRAGARSGGVSGSGNGRPADPGHRIATRGVPLPEVVSRPEVDSSAGRESGKQDVRKRVQKQVLEIVSRVSALPLAGLSLSARLSDDLGLDSLMMVELGAGMQEAFRLTELPEGMVGRDATLADVVDRVVAHVQSRNGSPGGRTAAAAAAAGPIVEGEGPGPASGPAVHRHVAEWVARPLGPAQAGELAAPGGAVIAADAASGELADALAARLRTAGRDVQVVSASEAGAGWPEHAGLFIDLASGEAADAGPDLDVSVRRASLSRARAVLARAAGAGIRPAYVAAIAGAGFPAAAGLARALAAEWPDRLAKAIELERAAPAAASADRIAAEIGTSDRTPEVSWATGARRAVALRPASLQVGGAAAGDADASADRRLARTALVTGGGRGLGARLARALAGAGVARLALIGSRPADEGIEELLAAIAAAGSTARYFVGDVRDPDALAAAVAEARSAFGPIELAVHAAGVNADGPVEKVATADLERVFDTKVGGALALWRACSADPLKCFLLYGSWAGRFGNRHQSIYAAANRALSALVAELAGERPERRVVAVDLPPWEGSGMVERLPEAVRLAMRGRGVPILTDEVGLSHILAELGAGPGGDEVVLGAGPAGSGARDRARVWLDPAAPWLADHAPAGEVRLPMSAALDLAVAGAARLGLAPPLAVRDFQILKAVTVPEGGRAIAVEARALAGGSAATTAQPSGREPSAGDLPAGEEPGGKEIEVELWLEPDDPLRGEARLAATARIGRAAGTLPALSAERATLVPPRLGLDDFYARHTFHGPRMHGIARVDEVGPSTIRGSVTTAGPSWPRAGLDILGLDGALQLAGFFAREQLGRSALPVGVLECRLLSPLPPASELECMVRLERADGDELVGDIDLYDRNGRALAQLRRLRARVVDDSALESLRPRGDGNAGTSSGKGKGNGSGGQAGHGPGNGHAIDPASYRVEQFPEAIELEQRMKMVGALGLRNPYFHLHERLTNQRSTIDGVEFINYSSYNYVGLSGHPEVNRAVELAIARYGTSVSASRVASGEKPLHRELEAAIADFLGCEDAVVMVGGHATNVSVIGHLFDHRDIILHDSLAHDSILGGARLAGARRRPFPHNDIDALARLLEQVRPHARRVLIAVEGAYSMDGDLPPLDRIVQLKKRHGALLLVDEAHSLGVVGATGRGIGEHIAVRRADVDLWMGTLSKSLASCGGYIAGSTALVQLLKYTNPGFVYSVGISPANAAAALAALGILAREPERVATLQARARYFLELMRERGIDTGRSAGSAVVPCIVASSIDCLRLAQALHDRRINVQPILYPAVEENLARLRFFVTSGHSEADLLATADAVHEELAAINPRHLRGQEARPAAGLPSGREASP